MEDKFRKLSNFLFLFTEALKKYEKEKSLDLENDIKIFLLSMEDIAKNLNKNILNKYLKVKEKTNNFLDKKEKYSILIKACLDLKNELWEL